MHGTESLTNECEKLSFDALVQLTLASGVLSMETSLRVVLLTTRGRSNPTEK